MPRRDRKTRDAITLGGALRPGASLHDPLDLDLLCNGSLLHCANEPVAKWFEPVDVIHVDVVRGKRRQTITKGPLAAFGFERVFGEPVDESNLTELRGHVIADLTAIAAGVPPTGGPRRASVTWWYGHPDGPGGLLFEVGRDLEEYFNWLTLLLQLSARERLRRCESCGRFWLVDDVRAAGRCPSATCKQQRRVAIVKSARTRYKAKPKPKRDRRAIGKILRGLGR